MHSEVLQNIFDKLQPNTSVLLSFEKLQKGIDNYHVDIQLSKKFTADVKKLAPLLITQIAVPKPKNWDNTAHFDKLRSSYVDLLTVLIHRAKTDLTASEICFLQFAPIKLILKTVRAHLDSEITTISSRLADHRNKGSSEALTTDQRLFWLKKNYDAILYATNKQIFGQLQRAEERQLGSVRNQFLGTDYQFTVDAIFNPLLFASELSALPVLLNEYCLWNWNAENSGFIELNGEMEKLLEKRLKHPVIDRLKTEDEQTRSSEIHDELGGLFATQPFLGLALDSKSQIGEEFSWFENQANIELLFNTERHDDELRELRKQQGFGAWWRARGELAQFKKVLKAFMKLLKSKKVLGQMLATHYMRRSLNPVIMEIVDLKIVVQYLCGSIPVAKVQDSIVGPVKLNAEQLKSLEALKGKIKERAGKADLNDAFKLLSEFSRYRQHLKYFRLAHRIFNRFAMRTAADELKLSQTAGTLYHLPTSAEIEEDDERICHHAILKADVRGSTTVTDELQNQGLNPASYFSMRFFNPINEILASYGAQKVFIEGDAIILSFLEYEHTPSQWFAVARACGNARDMLKIVGSNNRHSTQMGLPLLELGIGICYSNEAPRYLYDEDKPIMISGAIGLADRMSSCSWNLRAAIQKSLFNIEVLRIADGEKEKGEKGQHYVRYNVNGILIDDMAFAKLKKEIPLKSIRMKLNGKDYLFHAGQYPDTNGRRKDLVIREGKIGIWRDNQIHDDPDSDKSYYEVVVNRKVTPVVLEAIAGKQAATAS